ncbi:MAG: hypothetical protein GY854_22370 [Deltaproteobacteria bacterium]|nr:hypothetical protein [Deltaproteobacteria bacterium]
MRDPDSQPCGGTLRRNTPTQAYIDPALSYGRGGKIIRGDDEQITSCASQARAVGTAWPHSAPACVAEEHHVGRSVWWSGGCPRLEGHLDEAPRLRSWLRHRVRRFVSPSGVGFRVLVRMEVCGFAGGVDSRETMAYWSRGGERVSGSSYGPLT